jgi:hypothetical protein
MVDYVLLSGLTKMETILNCILEVPSSSLGRHTSYPDCFLISSSL